MKKFIAIAFVAMLAVIISSSMTAQNANYTAKCAMCHGADGSGKAAMKVEPFSAKKTEAERIAAIKNGASGAGPRARRSTPRAPTRRAAPGSRC